MVRNKANFGVLAGWMQGRSCKTNPIPEGVSSGKRAKQSQFGSPHRRQGQLDKQSQFPAAVAGCTNKPNFAEVPVCETKPICLTRTGKAIPKARSLEAATHQGEQACETKPISRLWIADWGQIRRGTPALWSPAFSLSRGERTKQSQFLPRCRSGDRRSRKASVRNKANLAVGTTGKASCTNKANFRWRLVVQTNPISRRCQCAKQSQFLPRCRSGDRRSREAPVRNKANSGRSLKFEVSSLSVERRACGTKPIPAPCRSGDRRSRNTVKQVWPCHPA